MLYKLPKKYGNKPAFKLKDSIGNIYNVSYSKYKEDVVFRYSTYK